MRVLVTGGGGFLGSALVRQLVARGDRVRSLARGHYPELARIGVETIQGDICDPHAVADALDGCDVVFHTAAKAGIWGSWQEYFRTNVEGTRNLLSICRRLGVRRFVFTSSPSVVFHGGDAAGIDESTPYARRFLAHYPATKARAEQEVLAANDSSLATVALRPHLIWGPGDNHLIPRILNRAKQGRLRQIGHGRNEVDAVYIDNAVDAHLLAADRLWPGATIAGKAYFIGNGEPIRLWWFINQVLAAAGLPPVRRSVSSTWAYLGGMVFETVYRILGRHDEPPMTRFVARQLSCSHWYDLTAARTELGYSPRVSVAEGLSRLRDSFAARAILRG